MPKRSNGHKHRPQDLNGNPTHLYIDPEVTSPNGLTPLDEPDREQASREAAQALLERIRSSHPKIHKETPDAFGRRPASITDLEQTIRPRKERD
mgnify:CR=1 FL=1